MLLFALLACRPEKTPSPPIDSSGVESQLTLDISAEDGVGGPIQLVFAPADGGPTLSFTVGLGVATLDLPAGRYGLKAWRDDDGDGVWDGAWSTPEPAALLGLTVPRGPLALPLRTSVPQPILDEAAWLTLYEAAWAMARDHVGRGTAENRFADAFMDEAFSEQIFQWDTCFMALFGLHGLDSLPVMPSLDNFYGTQAEDGYICRVVNESDGAPGGDASDPSEPMINPPLFATAELAYARRSGDLSRLPRVLPALDAYADWIDANVRTGSGLYYTSLLGSGMDNAPRDAAYDGWVDITSQQALARRALAELATLAGDASFAADQLAEAERVCAEVSSRMWDDEAGWFFDLDPEGAPLTEKTLAGVWPLAAGCADADQAARVIAWLEDPAAFWRVHPFASTAADAPSFDPDGHYWRGGVWAPTNHMVALALSEHGRRDLAREATARQLDVLSAVYADFVPDPDQLASDATGDGRQTLWELYAPDAVAPGTRWDDTWLGRQDFVGWTGLTPIAGLIEQILGLEPDAPADTLTWHLARTDRHGVSGYRFGDQLVDLVIDARDSATDGGTLTVESSDAFTLVVEIAGRTQSFPVAAGSSTLTLEPTPSRRAAALVPAGPFPGYAILGNGRIAAVYSTSDGSDDPPGALHLYAGDHGTDLLELGQTLVGQGGRRAPVVQTGLDPFFAAYAEAILPDGARVVWRSFAAAEDPALVTEGAIIADNETTSAIIAPLFQIEDNLHIDGGLSLVGLDRDGAVLTATLSDGRALALGLSPAPDHWELGTIVADPVAGGLRDRAGEGRQLALSVALTAGAGGETPFRHVLALGDSPADAVASVNALLAAADPLAEAGAAWADLAPGALCAGPRCAVASANLAAAASSVLNGAVPADMTGQFVTNDRPQLYPRDAAMVARALIAAGRREAALQIVRYWLDPAIDGPADGEWYARYDALGRGVDAGSGAAFDTPEWDFNAYLPLLVESLGEETLSAAERERLLVGLDFLVASQDADGLWTEGGIVEWEGRLPATAMIAWTGLDAGARLADSWGESARAAAYRAAAGRARGGLLSLIDEANPVLSSERSGVFSWDVSLFFGPVLGYPADEALDQSYRWLSRNARAYGGGVRYFEDPWGGTGGYGQDLFFFTTAATAWYARTLGDDAAAELVDWMIAMSNAYGLAPERVYADGGGAAPASPLSWCAAELALGVLAEEAQGASVVFDGEIGAAEHRSGGFAVVDHDGLPDESDSLVAMYASANGDFLDLGLRLAGPADAARYTVWLSGADGRGDWTTSEAGEALGFRAEDSPGAVAAIVVDLADGGCEVEAVDGQRADCVQRAVGRHGVELRVALGALGLSAPVQLIAEGEEGLLPASGSLSTAGPSDTVLVTFEVDASGLGDLGGELITLSGDRDALGAWAGNAVALDDASGGLWRVTVAVERGGFIAYKYLTGTPGDGQWTGVEFEGEDRALRVDDLDGSGRVVVREVFGVRGGVVIDP